MTNLSLSNLVKVNVSTYTSGPLSDEGIYDDNDYDLYECWFDVKQEGGWVIRVIRDTERNHYDVQNLETELNLDREQCKLDIADHFKNEIEQDVELVNKISLKDLFAKYGMDYLWMKFYTPKAYNFENDSIDIKLEPLWDATHWYDFVAMWLEELINEYIDEVRQKSYDWYMSFEPHTISEVARDDYCVIRAILKKEGVYDTIRDCMLETVEEWIDEIYRCNSDVRYVARVDWERVEFKLDYEKKTLVPIDEDDE